MSSMQTQVQSFVELLHARAELHPARLALRFLEDGVNERCALTYRELHERAAAVAVELAAHCKPGDRALLLFPSGVHYVTAFLGCLYAGVIAVPAYPPHSAQPHHAERVRSILRDAAPTVVLTESALLPAISGLPLGLEGPCRLLATDALGTASHALWRAPPIARTSVAFLQYTSGSTSRPKGVMVGHDNLLANEAVIQAGFALDEHDVVVSWLPLFHDMGLIGCLLQPLFAGASLVLMPPQRFIERPQRWLHAIAAFGGTVSGGPNFAYRMCAERLREPPATPVDLSRWRLAFCGSEPIQAAGLRAFADRASVLGFPPSALYPCYGLAEATLFVTGVQPAGGVREELFSPQQLGQGRVETAMDGQSLVSCGTPRLGHEVAIVDADGRELAPGRIGEIQVHGPSVMHGYWKNEGATRDALVMRAGKRFLRTGDLGFVQDGELFVAGRLKDLIIVRGQNLYPQDLEALIEAEIEVASRGRVAAFALTTPTGEESYGVALEIGRRARRVIDPERVCRGVAEVLSEAYQETPLLVLLVEPGGLPVTSSGKLMRQACRRSAESGALPTFFRVERGQAVTSAALGEAASSAEGTENERRLAEIWREVLMISDVPSSESFFALGGNSLKAVQMLSQVRDVFGAELTLRELFEAPTLRALAAGLPPAAVRDLQPRQGGSIPRASRAPHMPLSAAEQRMWFLHQLEPLSPAYHIAAAVRLRGALSRTALERALAALVARHEQLRATYVEHDGSARRVTCAPYAPELKLARLDEHDPASREEEVERVFATFARTPFDLRHGPLVRFQLVRVDEQEHRLLVVVHHIVADGWSMDVLLRELVRVYGAAVENSEAVLTPIEVDYADYAAWQAEQLGSGAWDAQLAYWKAQLGADDAPLELPADSPRQADDDARGGILDFELPAQLTDEVASAARKLGVTPFMLMLGVFQLLLQRYTGRRSIRVGVPVASRSRTELEPVVGLFVNTQVLETHFDGDPTFLAVVERVRDAALSAQANQDVPFERIVEAIAPARSAQRTPLFQVMFSWRPEIAERSLAAGGLTFEREAPRDDVAKFDLTLHMTHGPQGLSGRFSYRAAWFDPPTIARLERSLQVLLRGVLAAPERPISELRWADERDVPRCVAHPKRAERAHVTLVAWIGATCARAPDAVAVAFEDDTLTYAGLEGRANELAVRLASAGVRPGARVGLLLPRSIDFVVALYAVLETGAAYVPLDPELPAERLRSLAADSSLGVLLVDPRTETLGRGAGVPTLRVDARELSPEPAPLKADVHPDQAAYVIYTSGSTGTPKGVVVTHGAIVSYVDALLDRLALPDSAERMAMVSTVAADLGHTVLFGALCSGRTLHLVSEERAFDPDRFAEYMHTRAIDVLKIVPSHLQGLMQAAAPERVLPKHTLIVGGEATTWELVERIRGLSPCRIINHYGPTETTVGVLTYEQTGAEPRGASSLPLGSALSNSHVYVLSPDLVPVPFGVPGEIYIGGEAVARGYLGRPDLTAARFVPDPWAEPGARMYRTGDRGRIVEDGWLEFLGRVDDQIKLRGYRVELGEIRAALCALDEVRDAQIVVDRTRAGTQRVLAYALAASGDVDCAALKEALAARLPEYMVPSEIVLLERFPLTPNGKVDRAALPVPTSSDEARYEAPVDDVEHALADVWKETLRVDRVGRHDSFFALGGDSILTLQVVAKARRAGLLLTAKQLFEHQTIAKAARVAERVEAMPSSSQTRREEESTRRAREGRLPTAEDFPLAKLSQAELESLPIALENVEDVFPLSPMQKGMLLHTLLEPTSGIYLMQDHYRIGSAIDPALFLRAWDRVVERHPALRASFIQREELMVQVVHRALPEPATQFHDWSELAGEVQEARIRELLKEELAEGYDLARAPLLRLRLFKLGERSFYFVLSRHHILVDAWCRSLMLVDFFTIYRALVTGTEAELSAPPLYRDFIAWLEEQDRDGMRAFWRDELSGIDAATPLAIDRPLTHLAGQSRVVDEVLYLTEAESQRFASAAKRYQLTPNTLAQGTWAVVLAQYSGRRDVVFGVTVAGRPSEIPDIHETVGLFINTLPLRVRVPAAAPAVTNRAWLRALQEKNATLRQYEQLPLVEIQALTDVPRGQPLFHSLFVFENAPLDRSLDEWGAAFKVEFGDHRTHTNYPLTVVLVPGREIKMLISYDGRLFEQEDVRRMLAHYRSLLLTMADAPEGLVRDLPLVSEAEVQALEAHNDTAHAYPLSVGYASLFAAQAEAHRSRVAVRSLHEAVTYGELDEGAERVGWALRSAGVGAEGLVAVLSGREVSLVASVLGIFKVGGAYMPLDPHQPAERLSEMLRLSGARAVVVTEAYLRLCREVLDRVDETLRPAVLVYEKLSRRPSRLPAVRYHDEQLAYVIYTSGSTGTPKGAMVTMRGMLNNQLSKVPYLGLGSSDIIAQTASQSFDISVWQLLTALLCGGCVELVPDEVAHDAGALLAHVTTRGITILESVPSLIGAMLSADEVELPSLRYLLPTGEALAPELSRQWLQRYPDISLVNAYGPAECADDVALHRIEEAPESTEVRVPIGRATDNNRLYLLNGALERVARGVVGEVCVAGVGVGRGYLNDPARTAEVFTPNPYGAPGERLYRTGDLARYRRDGLLEFVGRRDQQVKVRGYRIELGEIEARLHEQPNVREAVVLGREDVPGQKRLVAYVVKRVLSTSAPEREEVQAYVEALKLGLAQRLPEYMVPQLFVLLDALPKLPSGKVDRKRLPAPDVTQMQRAYVAPVSALEQTLAGIWSKLLRVERVGLDDNFFELGGDSIIALQVVGRAKAAGVSLQPGQVLQRPTLRALAAVARFATDGERASASLAPVTPTPPFSLVELESRELESLPVATSNIEDVYPLSPMQQGMLLHTLLEPGSGIYVMQEHFRFDTAMDPEAFAVAWLEVVENNQQLRASFVWQSEERMLQIVNREVPSPVELLDWGHLDAAEQQAALKALVEGEQREGFDLTRAPLIRFRLIRFHDQSYYFIKSYHHILIDGWCSSLLLVEFFARYQAITEGTPLVLGNPPAYREFIAWLCRQDRDRAHAYWRETLRGFTAATPLAIDRPLMQRSGVSSVAEEVMHLSREETAAVLQAAQRNEVTPNTLAQGAWALLLSQYSGQRDVLFGVTVAGRPTEIDKVEDTVGLFINTIPLRTEVPHAARGITVRAWLQRLLAQNVEMRQFEHVPLVEVQGLSELPRGQRLFDSLFVFENTPIDDSLMKRKYQFQADLESHRTHTNYPLTVVVIPGRQVKMLISYDQRLFDTSDVKRMLAHYRSLLLQMAAGQARLLRDLPLVSDAEVTALEAHNDTAHPYPLHAGYACLFATQVEAHRERVAVRTLHDEVTYEELDAASERVGWALRSAGVCAEGLVAVLSRREVSLIASIVGIYKVGGAYLPLDPHQPAERLSDLLGLSGAKVLVVAEACLAVCQEVLAKVDRALRPVVLVYEELPTHERRLPAVRYHDEQLAYVIYTSGSTGTPKGAMVTMRGMLNNQLSKIPYLGLGGDDVIAQTASQSFDISVWQLLTALLCGARVEMVPDEIAQDASALLVHVAERSITILESVPSLIGAMLSSDPVELDSLRYLLPTGEALSPELSRQWLRRYPEIPLVNAYGPAECADDVALYRIESAPDESEVRVPIGSATDNNRLYLLDEALERVAPGVVGEVCVAGVGVGRGYVHDPVRTAEVFVPNPHGAPGERLYRTGDLARHRRDGMLEFVGRRDQQVKVRGYRIELGEIEARLHEQPHVREAAVLAREDLPGQKRLVAYVSLRDGCEPEIDTLKAGLATRLPEYMVPSQWVTLDALPKLPNGKLDRKALPPPDLSLLQRAFVAPVTDTEKTLAEIWAALLQVERVGLDDNFFELGGDSIIALQIVARAKKVGIQLQPAHVLRRPSLRALAEVASAPDATESPSVQRKEAPRPAPARFALAGLTQAELEALPVPLDNIEDVYPLSPMQQGMLLHTLLEPGSGIYLMQEIYQFDRAMDPGAFVAAWEAVIRHHPQLRTSFVWQSESKMLQIVQRDVPSPVQFLDWGEHAPNVQQAMLKELVEDELRRGYDLATAPLLRLRLIRFHDDSFCFVESYHHILIDGWCSSLLLVEFFTRYQALLAGTELALPKPPLYRDFIAWLGEKDRDEAMRYWRETLRGFTEVTPLAVDRPKPKDDGVSQVHEEIMVLTKAETALVGQVASRCQLTVNTIAQGAWAVLLTQYSGQRDILFGVTVAGRPMELDNIQDTVGLFINTIPLRTELPAPSSGTTVASWLHDLLSLNLTMRQFEHVPLVEVQALSEIPRGRRLFDSLFVFENTPLDPSLMRQKFDLKAELTSQRTHTNYPLTMVVTPGAEVELRISYDSRLFELADMQRVLAHYRAILLEMVRAPEALLRDLPRVSETEAEALESHNDTAQPYPLSEGYASLFAAQVEAHHSRVAVRTPRDELTYGALDEASERVGWALRALGVGAENMVAVLSARESSLVASIVGIFKTGAAYLPLDPHQPTERLSDVLRLSGAKVLLVTEACLPPAREILAKVEAGARPTVLVYEKLPGRASRLPAVRYHDEQLAYVIYTSGSTGTPKGAMVTMRGMLNNQLSKIPYLGLSVDDAIAQTASQSFDISVWQLLTALLCGARVELVPDEIAHDAGALLAHVAARGITILESVPSLIGAMLSSKKVPLGALRYLLPTGEALSPELSRQWLRRYPGIPLVNAYGPAECADDVALYRLENAPDEMEVRVPIGSATDNNRLYLLDATLERVAPGVVGEVCVAGVGVGRGYVNDPVRTAEVFVPNPYGAPGERLYRTGDLARYRRDGMLEFVGRRDQQVKVRGYRIELGEIEARLHEQPGVREAAVLAREDVPGQKRLVAYVGTDDGAQADVEPLKAGLATRLPEYMVPLQWVALDTLPKLPNGKLDRKALPAPDLTLLQREYVAPVTKAEKTLAEIWGALLVVERVGLDDNFFELGGDSIIALQIVARAKNAGLLVQPTHVLRRASLRALAAVSIWSEQTTAAAAEEDLAGPVPLLPIQRWFFEQDVADIDHWNLSVLLEVPQAVQIDRLERALAQVVEHHDVLRMRFRRTEQGWEQRYGERDGGPVLARIDLSHSVDVQADLERAADEAQRSLSLENGPVWRFVHIRLPEGQRLLAIFHHLVSDTVSLRILFEDLHTAYTQLAGGALVTLPEKTTSYKRWSERLHEIAQTPAVQGELAHWRAVLGRDRESLPAINPRGRNLIGSTRTLYAHLTIAETQQLLTRAVRAYRTEINELLLTGLAQTLCTWSGLSSLVIELDGHGREPLFDDVDLSRTVGWFTAPQMVRLRPVKGDLAGSIRAVQEQVRQAPNHGIGYGLARYLTSDGKSLAEYGPPQVFFNYLGQFDQLFHDRSWLRVAHESRGHERSPEAPEDAWFGVGGAIHEGRLRLEWRYSTAVHSESVAASLLHTYADRMRVLIDHCSRVASDSAVTSSAE